MWAADMPPPEVSCTTALGCLLRCTPVHGGWCVKTHLRVQAFTRLTRKQTVHGNANDALPGNGPLRNITTRAQCLQHVHSVYNLCTVSAACAQYLQQVHRVYQHVHSVCYKCAQCLQRVHSGYKCAPCLQPVHDVYPQSAQRLRTVRRVSSLQTSNTDSFNPLFNGGGMASHPPLGTVTASVSA